MTPLLWPLVACNFIFLFHQQQFLARKPSRDFERDPEANRASADDDYVVSRIGHAGGLRAMFTTA